MHEATRGLSVDVDLLGGGVAVVLAETGIAPSRGEARRLIAGRRRHGQRGARHGRRGGVPEPIAGEWFEVRIGKRNRSVVRVARA